MNARYSAAALLLAGVLSGCAASSPGAPGASSAAVQLSGEARMRADSARYIIVAVPNPLEHVPGRAGTSLSSYGAPPRYTMGNRASRAVQSIATDYGLREVAAWPIPPMNAHCVVFEINAGASREALLQDLSRDDRVQLAQPLQDFSVNATPEPQTPAVAYNDPYMPLQQGFGEMQIARAHKFSTGKGAHVAVIDTGAQTEHPELRGQIDAVYNLVDENAATFQQDQHGTQVAGIIAAVGNNLQGIVGIAPEAKISLYKACWYPAGQATAGARCNSFTLAKALVAVMSSDARTINLSLGGPEDPLLSTLLGQLVKQGRSVVAALPSSGERTGFPAGVPGVIVVGAADTPNLMAKGILAAPGKDVLTLQPQGRYDFATGSSMAAAHVSGMIALMQASAPQLDGNAIKSLLMDSEKNADKPLMVNAERALELLPNHGQRLAGR